MQDNKDEPQQVTAESYGVLDTNHVSDECWLIRIPHNLAEALEKAPEGADLGELVFSKGGMNEATKQKIKPSVMIRVSEDLAEQSTTSLPLNYSLQAMTKKVPVVHPVVRNPKNGMVNIMGTVTRTANAQVEQDSKYRALLKDRLVATNITSSRFVKPVEVSDSVLAKQRTATTSLASTKKGFGDAVFQVGKRNLEATQEGLQQDDMEQGRNKKTKRFTFDQPLRSVIFELFSQQQFWALKALKSAAVDGGANVGTKKAETELRNVLRDICDYHRSGDHKNMWELRKEFQNRT